MADTGETAPRRRSVWRGLGATLLIGLGIPGVVVLIAVGAWFSRTTVAEWILEQGATIVGGCCEVGPDHIAEIARRLRAAGHQIV